MKMKYLAGFAAALSVGIAPMAGAQTVTEDNSNPMQVGAISTYQSFFNQLNGMSVSWVTKGGSCAIGCTDTWHDMGSGVWGASGSGFKLTAYGSANTYGDPFGFDPFQWDLQGSKVLSFSIDASSANAVFDIVSAPNVETPGSSYGNPYNYGGCFFVCFDVRDNWHTSAVYSNPIGVGGNAPVGDLYSKLDVSFCVRCTRQNPMGNGFTDQVLFSADMDLVEGGFSTPQEATPEPAEMTLLATGLVGLAGFARRKRRA